MSMQDDVDREDRIRGLEQFANSSRGSELRRGDVAETAAATILQSMDRVYGAQKVAVFRDEAKILERLKLAAAAAGSDFYYRWSVKGKDGKTEWVEGPSIKLADDLVRIFGNCDLDTRSMDIGESWVFLSRFIDLETGYSRTRPFQQRKGQRTIKGDADRARDIAFQIGCSKAERNVVVHALRAYADFAFEEAKKALIERIDKDLPGWRDRVIEGLQKQNVALIRVEKVIGRTAEQWLVPDVAKVIAIMKAISDGMATWEESFPSIDAKGEAVDVNTGEVLDKFAKTDTGSGPKAQDGDTPSTSGETESGAASVGTTAPENASSTRTTTTDSSATGKSAMVEPKTEAEYIAHADAWREAASNAEAALAQWTREKALRNACKVGEAARDELKSRLDAKVTRLKGGKVGS